jgi:hypothetical protein
VLLVICGSGALVLFLSFAVSITMLFALSLLILPIVISNVQVQHLTRA